MYRAQPRLHTNGLGICYHNPSIIQTIEFQEVGFLRIYYELTKLTVAQHGTKVFGDRQSKNVGGAAGAVVQYRSVFEPTENVLLTTRTTSVNIGQHSARQLSEKHYQLSVAIDIACARFSYDPQIQLYADDIATRHMTAELIMT